MKRLACDVDDVFPRSHTRQRIPPVASVRRVDHGHERDADRRKQRDGPFKEPDETIAFALPAAGRTVFNRTIVDDNRVADWYPVISQLPSDLAWRLDYTVKFGAPPSDFADLYYDAAIIVLNDIAAASQVDAKGELIVNRAALATAVRNTSSYPGVTCSVTIDPVTGDRTDDEAAISACAG